MSKQIIIIILLFLFEALVELAQVSVLSSSMSKVSKNQVGFKSLEYIKKRMGIFLMICIAIENTLNYLLNLNVETVVTDHITTEFTRYLCRILYASSTIILSMFVKSLGNISPEKTSLFCSSLLYYPILLLTPLGALMSWISVGFFRLFKIDKSNLNDISFYRNEIFYILESNQNTLGNMEEFNMTKYILNIRDVMVYKIMTHRVDFVMCELTASGVQFKKNIMKVAHLSKRIVLWEKEEENIIGSINVKDYLIAYEQGKTMKEIKKLVVYPKFIINTTSVYAALEIMRNGQHKMLFVVDEYGTIEGMVTLTDIVEEIFGVTDNQGFFFQRTTKGAIVEGSMNIRTLNRKMNWNLPDDEVTVGGLVISLAKRILQQEEIVFLDEFKFTILKASKNKIERLLCEFIPPKIEDDKNVKRIEQK